MFLCLFSIRFLYTDLTFSEALETDFFLAARDNVPLKQEFKPALKLLSRKPVIQRVDPVTGLAKTTIDDDEEEEGLKKNQPTPEEIRLKTQREREEKQRRYDEARARILGTSSGSSTPGNVTPPTENGKTVRGKGRGRGGDRQERRPEQSVTKELFDPSYSPKPGVTIQKRNEENRRYTPREEEQIIRTPKVPDGSGGFANIRGAKKS